MATFDVEKTLHPTVGDSVGYLSIHAPPPSSIPRKMEGAFGHLVGRSLGAPTFAIDVIDFASLDVDNIPPVVLAGIVVDPVTVDVGFSDSMLFDAAMLNPVGWITNDPLVSVVSVAKIAPFRARLTVKEMLQGKTYSFLAPSSIVDAAGNVISSTGRAFSFIGVGGRPSFMSIERISSRRLRAHFSEPMRDSGDLRSAQSYSILPVGSGAPVFVGDVQPEHVDAPTYVDIDITEQTNSASYTLGGGIITDIAGNVVTTSTVAFTGIGVGPKVAHVQAISANRVDVHLDEAIQVSADALNPAKYTWSGGLTTVAVLGVFGSVVSLVTSDQTAGAVYTLTVSP